MQRYKFIISSGRRTLSEAYLYRRLTYTRTVLNVRYDGVFNHGIRFKRECRRLKRDFGIVITTNGYDLHYLKNTPYPKLWERVLQFLLDI